MAKNTQLSDTGANAEANALARLLDGGSIKIYDGTQPLSGSTAITTQNLLATVTLANPSAPSATAGALSFTNPATATISATGTAAWFRACKSDGTGVFDGTAGAAASTPNLTLSSTSFIAGATLTLTGITFQVVESNSGS